MSEHGHTHSHGEGDNPYYLDQLCLVALSGAFGWICLGLYFWRQDILANMLGPQFHLFILISGIALVLISMIRGAVLWIQVGSGQTPGRDHHGHDHGHEHPPAVGHDHEHSREGCTDCHEPGHSHEHGVEAQAHHHKEPGLVHLHSHTHGDHDHSWAPWRYVVLLIPVILFLIGLPNKGPQVQASNVGAELGGESHRIELPTFLAMGPPSLEQLAMTALVQPYFRGKAPLIEFTTLEGCSRTPELQQAYKGRLVSVKGQFVPDKSGNPRVFSLGRFRINCCAADAIQLNVPIVAKEAVPPIKPNDWVLVTGEIDFFSRGPEVRSILRVHSRADIVKTTPESNPYVKD